MALECPISRLFGVPIFLAGTDKHLDSSASWLYWYILGIPKQLLLLERNCIDNFMVLKFHFNKKIPHFKSENDYFFHEFCPDFSKIPDLNFPAGTGQALCRSRSGNSCPVYTLPGTLCSIVSFLKHTSSHHLFMLQFSLENSYAQFLLPIFEDFYIQRGTILFWSVNTLACERSEHASAFTSGRLLTEPVRFLCK